MLNTAAFSAPNDFGQWARNLTYTSFAVTQFASNLISGGPVIQSFVSGIENLTGSVLKYSTTAFQKATENEVNRLAAGGAISNSFNKKIDFESGLGLFDEIKVKLAKSAASLPGTTADYITVFRSLSDDMATALNTAGSSAASLKSLFREKVPKAVENLVLQTKLYGQDIPVSSITRTYSKLLSTGKVNSKEIFVQRNPVLRTGIENWEKQNGKKLPQLNVRDRFEALNKIFADSISTQQMAGLTNSFQAKVETIKSFLFDPDVGMFGFEREFKNASGQTTTIFKTLAKAIGPVIDRFSDLTQNLISYGDPAKAAADVFDGSLGISLADFQARLGALNQAIQITEGDFKTKLRAGLIAAFNFDFETFDFAAAIRSFFTKIAKAIETFGDNIKPDDKLGNAMSALLEGLFKVASAVMGRLARQAAEHPVETAQFVALTNPGALLQGITAFTTTLIVAFPVISFFTQGLVTLSVIMLKLTGIIAGGSTIFSAIAAGIGAITAVVTSLAFIVVAVIAFIAAIVVFKEQLLSAGKYFTELSNTMSGPFQSAIQSLGWSLSKLGEAGTALSQAWNDFASGNWREAIYNLFKGLVKIIQSIFGGLGSGAQAIGGAIMSIDWGGMLSVLKTFCGFLLDGLSNLFFGSKNASVNNRAAAMNSVPEINQQGAPLDGLTNVFKNQINTIQQFYNPGSKPVFTDPDLPIKNNAFGNPLGNLLAAVGAEQAAMPNGANIAISNSSEAVLTSSQAQSVMQGFSTSKSIGNITVNVVMSANSTSAEDVGAAVRRELIALLD